MGLWVWLNNQSWLHSQIPMVTTWHRHVAPQTLFLDRQILMGLWMLDYIPALKSWFYEINQRLNPLPVWWQLQVWSQWDREQMSILWIVSLKPANSKYKTRERALSTEWNNMGHSFPHTQAQWATVLEDEGGFQVRTSSPRPVPAPSLSDTSKVQTIGIFRVFTTSAESWGRSMWNQPRSIFRNVSIAAVVVAIGH